MSKDKRYASSQTELGVAVGRSLSTIVQYKGEGAPVKKGKRGYLISPVIKWIKENRKQDPGRRASKRITKKEPGGGEAPTALEDYPALYEKERALKMAAERARAELEQKIREGEYIPIAEVKDRDLARVAAVRSGLLSLPRRIAQDTNGLSVPQADAVCMSLVRKLLKRFSRM